MVRVAWSRLGAAANPLEPFPPELLAERELDVDVQPYEVDGVWQVARLQDI